MRRCGAKLKPLNKRTTKNLQAPQHSELPPFGMPLTDPGVASRMHAQGTGARRQHNWFMIIVSFLLVGPFLLAIGIACLL
ncbi:MAG TPA: hypothetical protein DDZ51_11355 [Planctomycetaceae bacterium]|nr:hypothetical protein [Planctomycetaceae bacterium]